MFKSKSLLFLLCETPLHAGSGDDLGIVDLPIQRERHTSYPKIEASSLKGALREACESKVNSKKFSDFENDASKIHRLFGFDDGSLTNAQKEELKATFRKEIIKDDGKKEYKDASDFAGALAFTDARLLLFPVKSMKGVFVWITCPQVLTKFQNDLKMAEIEALDGLGFCADATKITKEANIANAKICFGNTIVLEEYAFEAEVKTEVTMFAAALANHLFPNDDYWKSMLSSNLVILKDEEFKDFVNMSTEVITRTKINNATGTVQDGALFTEEYLPSDSVMYSLIMAADEYGEKRSLKSDVVMSEFHRLRPEVFQLGGNATLGKGILKTVALPTNEKGGN